MQNFKNKILEAVDKGISNALSFNLNDYDSDSNDLYIQKKKVDLDKDDNEIAIKHNFKKCIDKIIKFEHPLSKAEKKQFIESIQFGCQYTIENNKQLLKQLIANCLQIFGCRFNLNWIDTINVTDMSGLFADSRFNGRIDKWNTSNVIDMSYMFYFAESFNQPIGRWDVSHVTNMKCMFALAFKFNQPIGNWDVSNVIEADNMFRGASNFDRDISKWQFNDKMAVAYHMFDRCPIDHSKMPINFF